MGFQFAMSRPRRPLMAMHHGELATRQRQNLLFGPGAVGRVIVTGDDIHRVRQAAQFGGHLWADIARVHQTIRPRGGLGDPWIEKIVGVGQYYDAHGINVTILS